MSAPPLPGASRRNRDKDAGGDVVDFRQPDRALAGMSPTLCINEIPISLGRKDPNGIPVSGQTRLSSWSNRPLQSNVDAPASS